MNISNNTATEQVLSVQTTEDDQRIIQQQIVVTPSPVHFNNHSQYSAATGSSELSNENGQSLAASELSPLQRQLQGTLHISDPPSITITRTAFFPKSPQLSADTRKDSTGNHISHPNRRVDTIAPVRRPKYYSSDRFIRSSRVAKHHGNNIVSPSSFVKIPTTSNSRDPNFENFHTEEASLLMNTNQENRNPNLPLGTENDR